MSERGQPSAVRGKGSRRQPFAIQGKVVERPVVAGPNAGNHLTFEKGEDRNSSTHSAAVT